MLVLLLVATVGVAWVGINQTYSPDAYALTYLQSDSVVTVSEADYGLFFDGPGDEDALVFYPGALVEPEAYAPLLHNLASQGLDVFLIKMPLNLAILDVDGGDAVLRDYSYENWYVGGHSMGGAMSSHFASKHLDEIDGIVLLGAYPDAPLGDDMRLIVVIGSEDHVVNQTSLEHSRRYYPSDSHEYVIEGGNHAQFGSYGTQRGDGAAFVTNEEQIEESVELIINNCLS